MNAFTAFATHTPAQKKGFYITVAVAAAVVLVSVVIMTAIGGIGDATATVMLVIFGGAVGITTRKSMVSAWGYATVAPFVFNGARKFGVIWRAIAALCIGRFAVSFFGNMAVTETGMLTGTVVGICLAMGVAMLIGAQYGHNLAKAEAAGNNAVSVQAGVQATATSPVDTRTSSPAAAIIATSPNAGAQMGDGNTKGGNIVKGKRGLWVGVGLGVLFLGFLGFNYAKQFEPKDPADVAQEKGVHDALYGDSSVQSATPPPTQVAAPAPPPAPVSAAAIPADGPALDNVLAIAAKVAKENPNDDSLINGEDDTSLATPVFAGRISQGGYPVYALQCDFQKQQCTFHNGMGNSLVVSVVDAANSLSPIRNADAINPAYQCQENICMDSQGQVVGTVSLDMRNYLANHTSR